MIVALAGGVGGARLAYGLSRCMRAEDLCVAVNTGDDFEYLGFPISPDIDTVCYTLAQMEDNERGWGRANETWAFMNGLKQLNQDAWFLLGDSDLSLHVTRHQGFRKGLTLTQVTADVAKSFGIRSRVIPMSDDPVHTVISTPAGQLEFQEYFVRQRCEPVVSRIDYAGSEVANVQPELLFALRSPALDAVVICPSNPWLSIAPMLAMSELRQAIQSVSVPVLAVSPIVGGKAVKGPAAKLMAELGHDVSALGVAKHYAGLITTIVIDTIDAGYRDAIESMGIRVLVTDTIMRSREDRVRLGGEILRWSTQ
jgi:LPPG:FO 2-phospho-L-lactate transferase